MTEFTPVQESELVDALSTLDVAMKAGQVDEAQQCLERAKALRPDLDQLLILDAVLLTQRNDPRAALQLLESVPGDQHVELKAVCLFMLGDPYWEGLAKSLEDSPDPAVGARMRELLGYTVPEDIASAA
jgi:hypothetical protein